MHIAISQQPAAAAASSQQQPAASSQQAGGRQPVVSSQEPGSSDGLDLLSVHQPQKWMVATRFYNETQARLTQVGPNSHISETNIAMYLQLLGMSGVPSGSSIPLQCAFFGTIAP